MAFQSGCVFYSDPHALCDPYLFSAYGVYRPDFHKFYIVLPAGSGKTTFAKRSKLLVDVDDLLSPYEPMLEVLRREAHRTGHWDAVNKKQREIIAGSHKSGTIVLLHGPELVPAFGVILGRYKVPRPVMEEVASKREDFHSKITRLNWSTSDCEILPFMEIWSRIEELLSQFSDPPCVMNGPGRYISIDKLYTDLTVVQHQIVTALDPDPFIALCRSYENSVGIRRTFVDVSSGFRGLLMGQDRYVLFDNYAAEFHFTPQDRDWETQ